jgi:hypothetical protein
MLTTGFPGCAALPKQAIPRHSVNASQTRKHPEDTLYPNDSTLPA